MKQCDWVNQLGIQCGQPMNHLGNHGNGLLTTPRDTWHKFIEGKPTVAMVEKWGNVYHEGSVNPRCMWFGTVGRCIYEIGHTLPHKEDMEQKKSVQ